jgi:acetoin utilization deacetylase AcuC-like enzyme
MIRIRKITNPFIEANKARIEEVREIMKKQFPAISEKKASEFIEQLTDPLKYKSLTSVFVAEDIHNRLKGFAILLYMPDINFCYLDFIAVNPGKSSSGTGGALYQRIKEEAISLDSVGIFFECLPDDTELCNDKSLLEDNRKRLAFYERFGARPVINTRYETRVKPEDDCPPYLVFDSLGATTGLGRKKLKSIIRAILERKYGDYVDEKYIKMVIASVKDDPVRLRPFLYKRKPEKAGVQSEGNKARILLYINEKHLIHHVKERGYVESPVRIKSIKKELTNTEMFLEKKPGKYPEKYILSVHDRGYFEYFRTVTEKIAEGHSVYPYVFPVRNAVRAPKELSVRAGYYCFDTFTPINRNAFIAAKSGVDCALSAADDLISGKPAAYVLTRPPGHHAEKALFGGFCYFNNCAIAAERLSRMGKVAILDIDYHHGNGQQQIFYDRQDVLTISVHGHPSFAYPYFSGFSDEKGENDGLGFNYNFPLPETISYATYYNILVRCSGIIRRFSPDFLVIALGLDTAKNDPTGTWGFTYSDFFRTGTLLGGLKIPALIIQEGGYKTNTLGIYAKHFFNGYYSSRFSGESAKDRTVVKNGKA